MTITINSKIASCLILLLTVVMQFSCSSNESSVALEQEIESVSDSEEEADNESDSDTNGETDNNTNSDEGTGNDNDETDETSDLDPTAAPSENFDLSTWNINIPVDTDNSGTSDNISETDLNNSYEDPTYFYSGSDGGMVFKCFVDGFKTSQNTSYTRSELREMLRAGNTTIRTQGITKNNWVFGSAPQDDINNSGGFNGELKATLAVNHVTTTGDRGHIGRVIVGQIHANDDEPLRIYYRKLPDNDLGVIYIAHEENAADETYYEMIGSRSNSAENPADGIALGEKFSYTVKVEGNDMWVTIGREGKEDIVQYVDMSNSGYDVGGQYMYFKAGVYNQNNSGNASDYAQATFYSLSNTHTK